MKWIEMVVGTVDWSFGRKEQKPQMLLKPQRSPFRVSTQAWLPPAPGALVFSLE